jgi:hypothetical protein
MPQHAVTKVPNRGACSALERAFCRLLFSDAERIVMLSASTRANSDTLGVDSGKQDMHKLWAQDWTRAQSGFWILDFGIPLAGGEQ